MLAAADYDIFHNNIYPELGGRNPFPKVVATKMIESSNWVEFGNAIGGIFDKGVKYATEEGKNSGRLATIVGEYQAYEHKYEFTVRGGEGAGSTSSLTLTDEERKKMYRSVVGIDNIIFEDKWDIMEHTYA